MQTKPVSISRGTVIDQCEVRISKRVAEENDINSKIRYLVQLSENEIILTQTMSSQDSLKFYKFNNGYLKMVLKPEDIPDEYRAKYQRRNNAKLRIEGNKIILNF